MPFPANSVQALKGTKLEVCMGMGVIWFPSVAWDSSGNGNKNVAQNGNGMGINVMWMSLRKCYTYSHHVISNSHFLCMEEDKHWWLHLLFVSPLVNNVLVLCIILITSAKEELCFHRCLFVAKTSKQICMKFLGKVGNDPMNKWLNFGGNCEPIRQDRWQDLYHDTGKMCLGGGMHCPSASRFFCVSIICHSEQIACWWCGLWRMMQWILGIDIVLVSAEMLNSAGQTGLETKIVVSFLVSRISSHSWRFGLGLKGLVSVSISKPKFLVSVSKLWSQSQSGDQNFFWVWRVWACFRPRRQN